MTAPKIEVRRDDEGALLSLLRSICDELQLIAWEVVQLGDALSGEEHVPRTPESQRVLQSFDLIGQHALAQARLLRGVEMHLSGHETAELRHIDDLIEAVPFETVRRRLSAAYCGDDGTTGENGSNQHGDIDWF